MLGAHPVGHIVDHPIKHVLDAQLFQNVGGFVGFAQTRPQPALGAHPGEGFEHVQTGFDQGLFRLGLVVDRLLVQAMANELPARVAHGFGSAGISLNHTRIETGGGRQAPDVDGVDDARQAGPHAVIGPAEVGHIGHRLFAMGRGDDGARHAGVKLPVLHIDHQVHHDGAFGMGLEFGAVVGKTVRDAWVGHGQFYQSGGRQIRPRLERETGRFRRVNNRFQSIPHRCARPNLGHGCAPQRGCATRSLPG